MTTPEVTNLDQRFGIAGVAKVVAGNGGLTKVVISTEEANGEMYLHGGHVTSWVPKGTGEVLYLSPNALFQPGKAIRGGIPVCFPWFGEKADDPAAPAHGFVRTKEWRLKSVERVGNTVAVSMSAESDEDTLKWWAHEFHLVCRATFGSDFRIELIATNTGAASFSFEEALHAYFGVGDAPSAFVRGLDATRFLDKTDNRVEKLQAGDVRFTAETDRIYLETESDLQLFDPDAKRCVSVRKENSRTTVVWNPWSATSIVLKDLGPDQWRNFACIETSNVIPSEVQLHAGQSHTMAALVQVAPHVM